jgi:hypothetical protein
MFRVAGAKKRKEKRPIFGSIRKPTAPAGERFGSDKPPEKAHPAARKSKHKKKPVSGENDADI